MRKGCISAFTLKNRCVELVGICNTASVKIVGPMTVYTRTSPLVLRLGVPGDVGRIVRERDYGA